MYPNTSCSDCSDCPTTVTPTPLPDLHNVCGDHYNLACIEYTGTDIDCLGITSGMSIPEILNIFSSQCGKCCVVPPIDCVLSDWGPWSTCTTTVGAGSVATAVQTRTRTVITPASNGGVACGPLTETRTTVFQPVCFTFGSALCSTAPNGTQVLVPAVCFYNDRPYYYINPSPSSTLCSNEYYIWFNTADNLWYITDDLGNTTISIYGVLNNNGAYYPASNNTTQVWENRDDKDSIYIVQSTVTSCGDYKTCFKLQVTKNGRIYTFFNSVSPVSNQAGSNDHLYYTYTYTLDSINYQVAVYFIAGTSTWTGTVEYYDPIYTSSFTPIGTLNDTGIYPVGTWTPDPLSTQPEIHMVMSTSTNTCVQPTPIDCVSTFTSWSLIPCVSGIKTRCPIITTYPSNNGTPCPACETQVCATPSCAPVLPTGLVLSIVGTSIVLSFNPVVGAQSYTVTYSTNGGSTYTSVNGATSPITLTTTLLCSTTYSGYIVTNCPTLSSGQTTFTSLTTPACVNPTPPTCGIPFLSGINSSTGITPKIAQSGFYDSGSTVSGVTLINTSIAALINANASLATGYLIGGRFNIVNNLSRRGIAKLKCDNTIDSTFTYTTGLDTYNQIPTTEAGVIKAIAVDTNLGRIYIGGNFSRYNSQPRNNFAVLDLNGNILSSTVFNIGTGFTAGSVGTTLNNADITDIKIQSDGRILVCGMFTNYNGNSTHPYLIRLNTNGTVDSTFNIGSGFTISINTVNLFTILIDSVNSIFVGGLFEKYQGVDSRNLVKIKPNGDIDNATFNTGTNINLGVSAGSGTVYKLLIQDNSFLIVCGTFVKYGATYTSKFMRLMLSNATLDSTYTKNTDIYSGGEQNSLIKDVIMSNDTVPNILICGILPSYLGNSTVQNYYVLNPTTCAINNTLTLSTPATTAINKIILK